MRAEQGLHAHRLGFRARRVCVIDGHRSGEGRGPADLVFLVCRAGLEGQVVL